MFDTNSTFGYDAANFPLPHQAGEPIAVTPAMARMVDALASWEENHEHAPSITELAATLQVGRTTARTTVLLLTIAGLAKHQAGAARDLKLIRPIPALRIVGRVNAGALVETFEEPGEILDLDAMFNRPGWFVLRVDCNDFEEIHIIAGDLIVSDADGEIRAVIRTF